MAPKHESKGDDNLDEDLQDKVERDRGWLERMLVVFEYVVVEGRLDPGKNKLSSP